MHITTFPRAQFTAICAALCVAFAAAGAHAESGGWRKGKYLPDIAYVKGGVETSLHAQRGKPVLVNFWASWCPVCAKEWKHVQAAYDEFGAGGEVEFVLLNMFEPHADGVAFAAKWGYDAALSDPLYRGDLSSKKRYKRALTTAAGEVIDYAPKWIPHTFVLNAEGKIIARFRGASKPGRMQKAIAKALRS